MSYLINTFCHVLLCLVAVMGLNSAAYGDINSAHQHGDEHQHQGQTGHDRNSSPLLEEMVQLNEVFRDVVSGVALGDGKRVHEALDKMHGAMEKTHEGVHHGTVTLKKNENRLKEFLEQDKLFHGKLEDLEHAAQKNDGIAMLSLTKQLLDSCVQCHRDFRAQ